MVTPEAYKNWSERLIVLSSEVDPTQSKDDFPRYEKLFGRSVEEVIRCAFLS